MDIGRNVNIQTGIGSNSVALEMHEILTELVPGSNRCWEICMKLSIDQLKPAGCTFGHWRSGGAG